MFIKRFGLLFLAFLIFFVPVSSAAGMRDWYKKMEITGGITGVFQGVTGNNDTATGTSSVSSIAYTVDLNFVAEFYPKNKLYIIIEAGEGHGIHKALEDQAGNKLYSITPNYDPYRTAYTNTDGDVQTAASISQAYYEGLFFYDSLTVSLGKMDIHAMYDQNAFAGDETSQFLSGILVRLTGTVFNELDNYYTPGLGLLYSPQNAFELTYIIANSSYDNVGNGLFQVGQINFRPFLLGLEGNFRLYYVYDNRTYTQIVPSAIKEANTGFGISVDQYVTPTIGVFFRYGSQSQKFDENTISSALSIGAHLTGDAWYRSKDYLGFGFGSVTANGSVSAPMADQTVMELYYHLEVVDGLSITPDLQMHTNLNRVENRSVTIFGIRMQAEF